MLQFRFTPHMGRKGSKGTSLGLNSSCCCCTTLTRVQPPTGKKKCNVKSFGVELLPLLLPCSTAPWVALWCPCLGLFLGWRSGVRRLLGRRFGGRALVCFLGGAPVSDVFLGGASVPVPDLLLGWHGSVRFVLGCCFGAYAWLCVGWLLGGSTE